MGQESTSVKTFLSSADEIEEPDDSYYAMGSSTNDRKKVSKKRKSSNGRNSTFSNNKKRHSFNLSLSIAGNSSDDDFGSDLLRMLCFSLICDLLLINFVFL